MTTFSTYGAMPLDDAVEARLVRRFGNSRIDLRSDTVTLPSAAMRDAMAVAEVGDDVYGEDPTVNTLEARVAQMLGKEAALFVSSGTQSNLLAMLSHCGRGDEVIVGNDYHSYAAEAGGAAVLGGISPFPLQTNAGGGLDPMAVHGAIKPDDSHFAVSRLLCLENTVSGQVQETASVDAVAHVASAAGLAVHMDGARLMNAAVALGEDVGAMVASSDSVSLCLSKGLGAPVGSVLAGSADFIARARRQRKLLGGGMRQAGMLAAAGLFALDHNIDRLIEDHRRADRLAQALSDLGRNGLEVGRARTNMVFVSHGAKNHGALHNHLQERGILVGGQSPAFRLVLHMGIDDQDLDRVIEAFDSFTA
jgi:threonine aldolase